MQNKLWTAAQSNTIERFVKELALDVHLNDIRDHLGRTILHAAVAQQNVTLVNCLICAGFNPNVKERCGVTPILIAVILNNKEICLLLLEIRACVRGLLFTNIPSPFAVASKMELNEIVEVLDPSKSDEDDDIVFYDTVFKRSSQSVTSSSDEYNNVSKIERDSPGFMTGIVGDVGTCKTNRWVMSRSNGYSWVGMIPGDLHTKGYFVESCFKEQGLEGFHYLVFKVLKRSKLTSDALKKKEICRGKFGSHQESSA